MSDEIKKLAAQIVAAAAPNGNTLVCDARVKVERILSLALLGQLAGEAQSRIADAKAADWALVGLTTKARVLETLDGHMKNTDDSVLITREGGTAGLTACVVTLTPERRYVTHTAVRGASLANVLATLAEKVST